MMSKGRFLYTLSALVCLVATSGSLLAAQEDRSVPRTATGSIPGEAATESMFINAGPGLAVYRGNTGWAMNFGLVKESANTSLMYGLDMGLDFWNFTPVTEAAGVVRSSGNTGIQVLGTVMYRFDLPVSRTIFPYVGLSIGPNFFVERADVTQNGALTQRSTTSVFGEFLLRPGFYTRVARSVSLSVEGKLGLLRSDFIFLPQANFVFVL